jgi:hypothetical protein
MRRFENRVPGAPLEEFHGIHEAGSWIHFFFMELGVFGIKFLEQR